MSRGVERALTRLARAGAMLAPYRRDGRKGIYAVFAGADRRRRALALLRAGDVETLAAGGAIRACADGAWRLAPRASPTKSEPDFVGFDALDF